MAVCSSCNVQNPDGAKFCKGCGSPMMSAGTPIQAGPWPAGGQAAQPVPPTVPEGGGLFAGPFPAPGPVPPTKLEGPFDAVVPPTKLEGGQAPVGRAKSTVVEGQMPGGHKGTHVIAEERTLVGFLVVMKGPGAVPYTDFPVYVGRNPIGRPGAGNNIELADPKVSAQHATVVVQGGSCTLMDLGSSNGTIVNHKRVVHEKLEHGAMIKFGATTLVFVPVPGAIEASPAGAGAA